MSVAVITAAVTIIATITGAFCLTVSFYLESCQVIGAFFLP